MRKANVLLLMALVVLPLFGKMPPKATYVTGSDSLIFQFRSQTGINAVTVTDTSVLNTARRWQGQGNYPGVDNWVTAKIPNNICLYGGLPGQSAFYSVSKTVKDADTLQVNYWKSLQVEANPKFGYRPWVGVFTVKDTLVVALAKTLANPQFGKGGAWQLYVKDYAKSLVVKDTIKLKPVTK